MENTTPSEHHQHHQSHHHHHHREMPESRTPRSGNHSMSRKIEKFVSHRIFYITGIAFLVAAILLGGQMLKSSFLLAGEGARVIRTYPFTPVHFLETFLPGILVVIISALLWKRNPKISLWTGYAGMAWLVIFHLKVLFLNHLTGGFLYPTAVTGTIMGLGIYGILAFFSLLFSKKGLLYAASFLFFLTAMALTFIHFGWILHQIDIYLTAFFVIGVTSFFITLKSRSAIANVLNLLLTLAFFMAWFLFRFVLISSPDHIPDYFIFAILFFLLFFTIWALNGLNLPWRFSGPAVSLLSVVIALVFLLPSFYILQKYQLRNFEALLMASFSTVLAATLYLLDKRDADLEVFPLLQLGIIVTSAILPLVFRSSGPVLFTGSLSVLLLIQFRYLNRNLVLILSTAALVLMTAAYGYEWVRVYLMYVIDPKSFVSGAVLLRGMVSGIAALLFLWAFRAIFKDVKLPGSERKLNRRSLLRVLKMVIFIVLYLAVYWPFFYLVQRGDAPSEIRWMNWYAYQLVFLIVIILLFDQQKSSLQYPAVIAGIISTAIFPFWISWVEVLERNHSLFEHSRVLGGVFHYLNLLLLLVLLAVLVLKLVETRRRYRIGWNIFMVYLSVLLAYILITEIGHRFVIYTVRHGVVLDDAVARFMRFPETAIIFSYFLGVLILGLLTRLRILRFVSIVLLPLILAKMLIFDFPHLDPVQKMVILLVLGAMFLVLPVVYTQLKRVTRNS